MIRARPEWRDLVTNEVVDPETPGAAPTDAWTARVPGLKVRGRRWVTIRPEDLSERTMSAKVNPEAETAYKLLSDELGEREREAAAAAKERTREYKRRSRASFGAPKKGAKTWIDANAGYVDGLDAVDITDCARDWMNGIEVRRGRGWRRLDKTTIGQEMLADFGRRSNEAGLRRFLAWLFGRTKNAAGKPSTRWSDVDWGTLDGFLDCVRADLEGSGAQGWPEWWPPGSGRDAEQSIAAEREATARELERLLEQFKRALASNAKCLTGSERKVVDRRIKVLTKWAADPDLIEVDACSDWSRSGYGCDRFKPIEAAIGALAQTCDLRRPARAPEATAQALTHAILPQQSLLTPGQEGFALTSPRGEFGSGGRRTHEGVGTQAGLPGVSRQVDASKMAEITARKRASRRKQAANHPF